MTLVPIASPERSENLIYTILPFSIGLWMLRFFANSENITEMVALLGLVTSLGALILYEISIEERAFNWLLKRWTTDSKRNLETTFLMWNLLVETWQTNREEPPAFESPYFRNQVRFVVEKSISSNPIRRRVWRLRGFSYLVPSFVLMWIVGIDTLARIPITVFSDWLTLLLDSFLTSLLWQSLGLVLILGLLVVINFDRHKDLVDHIQYLTEFTYLQILIAMVFVKRMGGHEDRTSLEATKKELQSLNEILLRGYWSMFAGTWPRLKTTLQSEAEDIFRGISSPNAKRLWGRFIQKKD